MPYPKEHKKFFKEALKLSNHYENLFFMFNVKYCQDRGDGSQIGECNANPLELYPFDALRLFLILYAYERMGSSPDYSQAADYAIDKYVRENRKRRSIIQEEDAGRIWNKYKAEMEGYGLNHLRNPLCPKGVRYPTGKSKTKTNQKSIVELIAGEMEGRNIIAWASEKINENKLEDAHNILMEANGVGPKIASFFLRDVAVFCCGKNLDELNNRYLLQPIDKWIRFVVWTIEGNFSLSDKKCAEKMLEYGNDNAERLNMGIWYFCTQLAYSSEYLVAKCLQGNAESNAEIDYFMKYHKSELLNVAQFVNSQ